MKEHGDGKRYPAAFAASSSFFCASIARRSGAEAISCCSSLSSPKEARRVRVG